MKQQFHYATVTEAIEQLRKQGFTLDLNLEANQLTVGEQKYPADEFEIVDCTVTKALLILRMKLPFMRCHLHPA